jgi:hypothetical protein
MPISFEQMSDVHHERCSGIAPCSDRMPTRPKLHHHYALSMYVSAKPVMAVQEQTTALLSQSVMMTQSMQGVQLTAMPADHAAPNTLPQPTCRSHARPPLPLFRKGGWTQG